MNQTNRLIFSNGPYTSLVSLSIFHSSYDQQLDKTYILKYYKNIHKSKHFISDNIFNNNINVTKAYDVIDYKKNHINLSKVLPKDINQIYLPINSTTTQWYKKFKKIYPNSEFILYEEGLLSYIRPMLDKKLKKIMKTTLNYYIMYNQSLDDFFVHYVKNIKYSIVDKNIFISLIKSINDNTLENYDNKKYMLFLPQYYFQKKKKKLQQLISHYQQLTSQLIAKDYIIAIKEHPKASISFYDLIKNKDNENNIIKLNSEYPIECIINKFIHIEVFSVYSTSLLSLPYIFNIKTYTSYDMLNDRINTFSIYPILSCLLIKYCIGDIHNNKQKRKINTIFQHDNFILNIIIKGLLYICK